MSKTKIEWTDATWQVTTGCEEVSPGCGKCYARTMAKRLRAMALADIAAGRDPGKKRRYIDAVDDNGRWTGSVTTNEDSLREPLGWKKPRRVFVDSMSDLFHADVPWHFIDEVYAVMYEAQWHTFQVLTKRPERAAEYLAAHRNRAGVILRIAHKAWWHLQRRDLEKAKLVSPEDIADDMASGWPLPNVWIGTSVEDQQRADERIPHLLRCPARIRFVSFEPLLSEVVLNSEWLTPPCPACGRQDAVVGIEGGWSCRHTSCRNFYQAPSIGWGIVGGESGGGARPCCLEWVDALRRQFDDADVRCFIKQLGSYPTTKWGAWGDCVSGAHIPLRDKKGGDMSEWPECLRVRQFPATEPAQ